MAHLSGFSLRSLLILSVALAAAASLQAQSPSFRSTIDLVMLNVTVTGPGGRRQVIVVLSDGEDTSSLVTFDHLLDSAKRSQTVIYTVGLGLEETSGLRTTRSDGEFGLRQLAQETGGRLFLPKRPIDLVDVYTQIANELTNQYAVGYLSSNARADGAWRRIAVRVLVPNLQARTRAGYYAATP